LRNSICIEDQNDSILALSYPSPTVPNDGSRPALRIFSPNTQDVNWAPWSACTIPRGLGFRLRMAMSTAFTTSVASWRESMAQPTMRRL